MTTLRLRQRYLAALGLSSSVIAGCSANEGGTTPQATTTAPDTTSTATVTTTTTSAPISTSAPTASATPSVAVVTPTVQTGPFWAPTVLPPPPPIVDPGPPVPQMPSCPSGAFCVVESNATAKPRAHAPFAKCAESVAGPLPATGPRRFIGFDAEQTKRERTATKDACCYEWNIPCPGGRPLVVEGASRVAPPTSNASWLARSETSWHLLSARPLDLPAHVREALAEHYAREASFEHASIAAFSRVSLSLLAVGAPPDLVADTHRAALDEIAHAEAMYLLASAHRRAPVGPGSLDIASATSGLGAIEDIAEEAFVEGCIGEVAAALVLQEEALRASDAWTRDMLDTMARDEERHAELAWRTVAWALAARPTSVPARLERARAAVARDILAPLHRDDAAPSLPGVTSARERDLLRLRALREVVLPCLDAMLGFAPHLDTNLEIGAAGARDVAGTVSSTKSR